MKPHLIEGNEQLELLCVEIKRAQRVAIDTEFHGERSYTPKLMIVQVAIEEEVFLIDALRLPSLEPLADALMTSEVVGHALQSDLKIFADRFDRLPDSAFDTQLAAAFCGYGLAVSLADLVHSLAGVRLRKSHTVSDWSTRPLSDAQINYLVEDVAHLFTLETRLRERLSALGREAWYDEEARTLVDLDRYRPDPERLYLRLPGSNRMNRRELGVLRALAELRDRLARERDLPPKYVIPDDAMASIVSLRPRDPGDLAQLRRIDSGMRRAYGQAVVDAVAAALALDEEKLPRRPARPAGAEREGIASLFTVLVAQIASDNDLPAALLAPRASLERVARELPGGIDEMARVLSGNGKGSDWRAHLVAEPLWRLLQGETVLSIEGTSAGSPRIVQRPGHA